MKATNYIAFKIPINKCMQQLIERSIRHYGNCNRYRGFFVDQNPKDDVDATHYIFVQHDNGHNLFWTAANFSKWEDEHSHLPANIVKDTYTFIHMCGVGTHWYSDFTNDEGNCISISVAITNIENNCLSQTNNL